jgi:hypothetical protein
MTKVLVNTLHCTLSIEDCSRSKFMLFIFAAPLLTFHLNVSILT